MQFALRSGLTMGSLFTGASMVHYILKPDLVRQEAPSKQNGLACAPRLPKLTCSRCESWACSSHRPCLTWQLQLRRLNEKLKGLLRRLPSAEQSRVLSSRLTWLDWATIPILPHQSTLVKLSLHEIHTAIRTWLAHVSALGVSVRCPAPSPPRQHIDIPRPPTRHAGTRPFAQQAPSILHSDLDRCRHPRLHFHPLRDLVALVGQRGICLHRLTLPPAPVAPDLLCLEQGRPDVERVLLSE